MIRREVNKKQIDRNKKMKMIGREWNELLRNKQKIRRDWNKLLRR